MANFNPINTQEEFDEAIKGRLERERAKFQTELDKMAGLQSTIEGLEKAKSEWGSEKGELNEKIKKLTGELTAAQATIKQKELDAKKIDIALEAGLPIELRSRLQGETEQELKDDAARLAGILEKSHTPKGFPGIKTEPASSGKSDSRIAKDEALLKVLGDIKKD